MLDQFAGKAVRVFVVWEPVLPTDWTSPSTATLKRIADSRVAQFWDKGRLISLSMGEHDRRSVVWDFIAVFRAGAVLERSTSASNVPRRSRSHKTCAGRTGASVAQKGTRPVEMGPAEAMEFLWRKRVHPNRSVQRSAIRVRKRFRRLSPRMARPNECQQEWHAFLTVRKRDRP